MKPSDASLALDTLVSIQQPCFLWGAPGVGKSSIVKQCAENKGLELIDVRAQLLDPVDLRGVPKVIDNKTVWNPPVFFPTRGKGILFLDELNAAPPSVQAACYQLILDRQLGEYHLPDGWMVIGAGNRDTDRAITNRMSTALKSRLVHLYIEVDINDWVSWALENDIDIRIIAFIRFRPNLLHQFDPAKNENSFANPRCWQFASNILKANYHESVLYDLISGTIGEGPASELLGFLKIYQQLPNPDSIVMNPTIADVPTDPATLYAIVGALVRKASNQTIDNICTYANRLPSEFSVLMIKDVLRTKPELANSRGYIDWSVKHQDVLM